MRKVTFPQRLKDLRKAHKLTQTQLAEELEITQANISRYESGEHGPDFETLIKLSEIFNVNLEELVFSAGFSKEEMEFMIDANKISAEELRDKYELLVDGIPATEEEIQEAIKAIRFSRFAN